MAKTLKYPVRIYGRVSEETKPLMAKKSKALGVTENELVRLAVEQFVGVSRGKRAAK